MKKDDHVPLRVVLQATKVWLVATPGRIAHLWRHRWWLWEDDGTLFCRLCNNEAVMGGKAIDELLNPVFEEYKRKKTELVECPACSSDAETTVAHKPPVCT